MLLRLHLGPDFLNLSLRVNEVCNAENTVVFAAHEFLAPPRSVGLANLLVLVGQQREGQAIFGHEFVVLGHRVAADAQKDGLSLIKSGVFITERADLLRSTGSIVLGIKKEDDMPTLEILQGHLGTTIDSSRERRSEIALL